MRGLGLLLCAAMAAADATEAAGAADLAELSLEELDRIEISSVSRRSERLDQVAASVYVIGAETLQRSGATSLAEALRLAPNLQVARISSSQYAISARGFNDSIANKLLVMIDGRTVYAPYFSGTHWEQQDLPLEEIARIEVISGAGGSVWGVNAVNGVINIISKKAQDSQGTRLSLGAGSHEAAGSLRQGGALFGSGHYRVYARSTRREATRSEAGQTLQDRHEHDQLGWRADWLDSGGGLTLQGDAYQGRSAERSGLGRPVGALKTRGYNLLLRWTRQFDEHTQLRVRAYHDRSEREDRLLYSPSVRVQDLELQLSQRLGAHQLDWGGGARRSRDDIQPGLLFGFVPAQQQQRWLNLFLQDEWQAGPKLRLIGGLKFERNDYTGWESLPSLRLAWTAAEGQLLWASLARAVRAPARLDRDLRLPPRPPYIIAGGPDFQAERALVSELGFRGQLSRELQLSLTLFHSEWSRLRSGQPPPNAQVQNMIAGRSQGLEAWAQWQTRAGLRLDAGLSLLHKDLHVLAGSRDPTGPRALGNDPRRQLSLRALLQLPARQELSLALRHVGRLPAPAVPAYTVVDLQHAWKPRPDLELSLSGRNLFGGRHAEFGTAPGRSEFGPSSFLQLRWTSP